MVRPDTDTDPRTYTVALTFEMWNPSAYDAGEPAERGVVLEGEDYDCEQLGRVAATYGFDAVSDKILWDGAKPVFRCTTPAEDRAHFDKLQDRYYQLQLIAVDGRPPRAADHQRLADYFGLLFDRRVPEEPVDEAELASRPSMR